MRVQSQYFSLGYQTFGSATRVCNPVKCRQSELGTEHGWVWSWGWGWSWPPQMKWLVPIVPRWVERRVKGGRNLSYPNIVHTPSFETDTHRDTSTKIQTRKRSVRLRQHRYVLTYSAKPHTRLQSDHFSPRGWAGPFPVL